MLHRNQQRGHRKVATCKPERIFCPKRKRVLASLKSFLGPVPVCLASWCELLSTEEIPECKNSYTHTVGGCCYINVGPNLLSINLCSGTKSSKSNYSYQLLNCQALLHYLKASNSRKSILLPEHYWASWVRVRLILNDAIRVNSCLFNNHLLKSCTQPHKFITGYLGKQPCKYCSVPFLRPNFFTTITAKTVHSTTRNKQARELQVKGQEVKSHQKTLQKTKDEKTTQNTNISSSMVL